MHTIQYYMPVGYLKCIREWQLDSLVSAARHHKQERWQWTRHALLVQAARRRAIIWSVWPHAHRTTRLSRAVQKCRHFSLNFWENPKLLEHFEVRLAAAMRWQSLVDSRSRKLAKQKNATFVKERENEVLFLAVYLPKFVKCLRTVGNNS